MDLPIQPIITLLHQRFPEIQAIYLYGSHAKKEATPASDIDLAILLDREISGPQRFEAVQQIAALNKREVDLVDLRRVPTVLQFQVISTGRRLDAGDVKSCEKFEDFVYKSYARLNEERTWILKDIRSRGTIF